MDKLSAVQSRRTKMSYADKVFKENVKDILENGYDSGLLGIKRYRVEHAG